MTHGSSAFPLLLSEAMEIENRKEFTVFKNNTFRINRLQMQNVKLYGFGAWAMGQFPETRFSAWPVFEPAVSMKGMATAF
jgi:hypothetical protein